MCKWLWLVVLVLGVWLWLTGGELWSRVRDSDSEDGRLAARVARIGGTLMLLALLLTLE